MKIVIKGKGGVTIKEAPFMDFDVIKDAEFFRIDGEKYRNKSYNIDFDKEEIVVRTYGHNSEEVNVSIDGKTISGKLNEFKRLESRRKM